VTPTDAPATHGPTETASEQAALCEAIRQTSEGESAMQQTLHTADASAQAHYDEQTNTIEVQQGSNITLPALSQLIDRPDLLRELSPGEWLLDANVQVGATAELLITAPQVSRLKLHSDAQRFVWIKAMGGTLRFENTCVTSWDPQHDDVDRNYDDGRSFVLARSGATMTVHSSELSYLGYGANESYGLAWRLEGTGGEITNSYLGYNYYGLFVYRASGIVIRGNEVHHSVHYGIDPHTASNHLIIEDNRSHHNGKHGIILAEGCSDSIIRNNTSFSNAMHGIVLYQGSNDNLVEGNTVYDNGLEGINVNEAHKNTIRDNIVYGNKKSGIGVGQAAENNAVVRNTVFENQEDGIALYSDARANLLQGNTVQDNLRYGIYVKSIGNQIGDEHRIFGNRIGIYLNVSPAPEVSLEQNQIYDNREDNIRIAQS
jgi:parallel beta-helix repeat protein